MEYDLEYGRQVNPFLFKLLWATVVQHSNGNPNCMTWERREKDGILELSVYLYHEFIYHI